MQLAAYLPQAGDGERVKLAAAACRGVPARSRRLPGGAAARRGSRHDPRPCGRAGARGCRLAGRPVPGGRTGTRGYRALADEAASLPLTGGRRVVRVRESDGCGGRARSPRSSRRPRRRWWCWRRRDCATRSRLRTLVEAAPDGAAIACYPEEGRALADTIRAVLTRGRCRHRCRRAGLAVGPTGRGPGIDHEQEAEKLALYAGPGGRVDLDAAMACVGDLAGLSLDDALFAATAGRCGDARPSAGTWRWPKARRRSACCARG